MEMLIGRQVFPTLETTPPLPVEEPVQSHQPIKLKEVPPPSANSSQSLALQLLLLIPEGVGVRWPPSNPSVLPAVPNCYLLCKVPVVQTPHPRTPIQWTTDNPRFLFRQVCVCECVHWYISACVDAFVCAYQLFPLCWSKSLVEKFCNNFCVVEVWHRGSSQDVEDQVCVCARVCVCLSLPCSVQLLGLVKLSLHQFYLDFSEPAFASLSLQSQVWHGLHPISYCVLTVLLFWWCSCLQWLWSPTVL